LERSQLTIDSVEYLVAIQELAALCSVPALVDLLPDVLFATDEEFVSLLEQTERVLHDFGGRAVLSGFHLILN
jgi:hypothetical protein